jgi:hypothetical protein
MLRLKKEQTKFPLVSMPEQLLRTHYTEDHYQMLGK